MRAWAGAASDVAWWVAGVALGIPLTVLAFALEKHTQKDPRRA